jgi:hypothetical protein
LAERGYYAAAPYAALRSLIRSSARGVKMAGLADLEAAPGISHETARHVYAHFHPGVRMEVAS